MGWENVGPPEPDAAQSTLTLADSLSSPHGDVAFLRLGGTEACVLLCIGKGTNWWTECSCACLGQPSDRLGAPGNSHETTFLSLASLYFE